MIPKQYILRMILTKRPVPQVWETGPKTLRELRDYLEKLNENPNPMTPNRAEGIRKKRQHRSYDWGQRVTPKKLTEYAKHMFAVDDSGAGCTVQIIENKPNTGNSLPSTTTLVNLSMSLSNQITWKPTSTNVSRTAHSRTTQNSIGKHQKLMRKGTS